MIDNFQIKGQYLKSMSVNHENAPRIFLDQEMSSKKQDISVNCSVNVLKISDSVFEISLEIFVVSKLDGITKEEAEAKKISENAFIIKIQYSSIIQIEDGLSEPEMEKVFFVSAPIMMFPYIRERVSSASLLCGFPAVMLSNIDFETKYLEQKSVAKRNSQETASNDSNII
ncbi:hypothetical protein GUI12_02215 [Anaplasmataceae bacterium AB001_6]|nr:hypothetical protein GUI12_02215 [Anaplasmataceae bacterium AB001_6]